MKPNLIILAIFASLIAYVAIAQNTTPKPASAADTPQIQPLPETVTAATTAPVAAPAGAPAPPAPAQVSGTVSAMPATTVQTGGAAQPVAGSGSNATNAANAANVPSDVPPAPKNEIRMNFQGASLNDVLNYLSNAAGFIIVQEAPVTGTVNVISTQPVTADEAVELLNTVLVTKGYVAIRNGRILKIVSRTGAQTHDLPVAIGSDPGKIPRVDEMVTQIIPIRYMDATKLIENLRPLLAADATINANESSNAILLTDTEVNIHRMAEIIHALDTSVSSISSIRVFPLRYADAKDFANVITQLFSPDTANNNNQPQGGPGAFFRQFGGGGRGGGGGGDNANAAPTSEARKAASRVVAVADTQSNSVVVSAPDEYMDTIAEIVSRLDTSPTDITETRIFRLEHADSGEVSTIVNTLYGDSTSVAGVNGNNQQNGRNNNNNGRPQQQQQPAQAGSQPNARALQQARVVAVADPRTNSLLVNCSHDTMTEVALTIGRLDSTDAKKQHVYVRVLQHADPDSVVSILRTLFGDTTSTTTQQSVLQQRTTTGASSDVTSTLNTNSTAGGNGR